MNKILTIVVVSHCSDGCCGIMLSTVKKLEFVTNELCIFCIFNRSAHDGRLSKQIIKHPTGGVLTS